MNKYLVKIRYVVTNPDKEGVLAKGDRVFFHPSGGIEIGYRLGKGTYIFSKDAEAILKTAEFEVDKEWAEEYLAYYRSEIKRLEDAISGDNYDKTS